MASGDRPRSQPSGQQRRALRPTSLSVLAAPSEDLLSPTAVHRLDGGRSEGSLQRAGSAAGSRRATPLQSRESLQRPSSRGTGLGRRPLPASTQSPAAQRWAKASQNLDRKFTDAYQKTSSPANAWSQPLDQGLSPSTQLQNAKREQYSQHFGNVQDPDGVSGVASARHEAAAAAAAETEAREMVNNDAFNKDLAQVTHGFDDLYRRIRLEHFGKDGGADEKARARAEAERRQKELEMRRARKKEQMARDPKRKVALKLERRRGQDDKDGGSPAARSKGKSRQEVPMQNVEVHSPFGSTKVPIVDVSRIKQRCEFVDAPISVEEMLDLRKQADSRARSLASSPSTTLSSRLFQSVDSSSWLNASGISCLSELSTDERQEHAKALRKDSKVNTVLHKIEGMRGGWTYGLPYKLKGLDTDKLFIEGLANVGGDVDDDDESESLDDSASDTTSVQGNKGSRPGKIVSALLKAKLKVSAPASAPKAHPKARSGPPRQTPAGKDRLADSFGEEDDELPTPPVRNQHKRRSSCQGRSNDMFRFAALKTTTRRCWYKIRACVQFLLLCSRLNRKHRCASMVRHFVQNLGEYARFKGAVKHFAKAVKILQQHIRDFLKVNHRRCALMEKEWSEIEDHHLHRFFHSKAKSVMLETMQGEEARSRARPTARQEVMGLLASGVHGGGLGVDISIYRVPVKERRAVIARYCNIALRKHISVRQNFLKLVMEELKTAREMKKFLSESMGAEGDEDAEDVEETSQPHKEEGHTARHVSGPTVSNVEWWHLSHETTLSLIAHCVQALAPEFPAHPANQAIPLDLHERTVLTDYKTGGDPHRFAVHIVNQLKRPCYKGFLGQLSTARPEDIIAKEEKKNALVGTKREIVKLKEAEFLQKTDPDSDPSRSFDVEAVFDSFTPRLQVISEEQAEEYNHTRPAGIDRSAGGGAMLQIVSEDLNVSQEMQHMVCVA
eukprot:TRINITY_DN60899_c0_g1_i1.p1 TRINITY_DN60899_c0_g1~~TRINITY_DN60899_c0_g1_i1.p1  ORF type:complete len:956 (-),score=194.40 TRINITY_DN60899_c0_g1_i1:71-2938(-)